ncbi:MAG: hypothetical protein DRR06_09125 [Gammaproteobacteria bacterium]|nr:MAG: hypothetical protein DRR06_09125 [Gammaproteobacteria bacterium]RLA54150.1 MAG: hypothetical protein DRR42_02770 [Gammaproteobacteria bacterium]
MTKEQSSRHDPFVARRDSDLGEPRADNSRVAVASVEASRKSGIFIMLVVISLSVALAGLGWFSWQQSQSQTLLQQRFDKLAAKITSTDESLSQSGAALSIRLVDQEKELDKHWSEIKKLWGVTNDRNKKAIAVLEKSVAASGKKHRELTKSMLAASAAQQEMTAMMSELRSDSLAAVASVDEVDERIDEVHGAQQKMRQGIDQDLQTIEKRLQSHQQAIEAIDAFRRQTNQTLEALRQASATP